MQQDIEEGLTTKHKTYIKAVYDRKEEEKKVILRFPIRFLFIINEVMIRVNELTKCRW
jgi:hypothetical protein